MLEQQGLRPNVIVIDPPRKGCDQSLIKTISRMAPDRVVYVSCDPATLARDLKWFTEEGYMPQEVTPVDMFPRTAHVETVVLLSRKEEKQKDFLSKEKFNETVVLLTNQFPKSK